MTEPVDSNFDAMVSVGLGEPPKADFDTWLNRHSDAAAYLNPVFTAAYHRRRRFILRLVSGATAAAVILAAAFWGFTPERHAFAQTVDKIEQAKTMSWTIDAYERLQSVDGKRSWVRRGPRWERAFLAPNRWRDVRYSEDGAVSFIEIEDTSTREVLRLDMQNRTAMLKKEPSGQFGASGPFVGIAAILKQEPIEFVGQQELEGAATNVFRHYRDTSDGRGESTEIWLDAESKQLVQYCTTPGNDFFHPETDPDHNNPPEAKFSTGTIAGVFKRNIVFDAKLDPSLFSLKPPAGFTIVDAPVRPKVTEDQMIQWLQLLAQANNGVFIELEHGFNMAWHNAIGEKPKADRSQAEKNYMEVTRRHMLDGNSRVLVAFADSFTEAQSFRYLGKGIRLGSEDSIVCFYKLKSTGKYRAVFGDMSVRDIDIKDLPLPVE